MNRRAAAAVLAVAVATLASAHPAAAQGRGLFDPGPATRPAAPAKPAPPPVMPPAVPPQKPAPPPIQQPVPQPTAPPTPPAEPPAAPMAPPEKAAEPPPETPAQPPAAKPPETPKAAPIPKGYSATGLHLGDEAPRLIITQWDVPNASIDLRSARGRGYVVVHFFTNALYQGALKDIDALLAVRDTYRKRGSKARLAFVSIDEAIDQKNLRDLTTRVRPRMDWPVDYNPKGGSAPNVRNWEVKSTPCVFLLDPDLKIVWIGPPKGLADAVEAAVNPPDPNAPPKPAEAAGGAGGAAGTDAPTDLPNDSPATRPALAAADWPAAVDRAEAAAGRFDYAAAVREVAPLPPAADADATLGPRLMGVRRRLADAAATGRAQAEALAAAGNYDLARRRLSQLADTFAGTPAGLSAAARLDALDADPAVKAAAAAAEASAADARAAAALLDDCRDARDAGRKDLAYDRLKKLAGLYPATAAGAEARRMIAAYDADPAFLAAHAANRQEARAAGLLSVGDMYRRAGNADRAREKYRQLLAECPDTEAAVQAKAALDELGN